MMRVRNPAAVAFPAPNGDASRSSDGQPVPEASGVSSEQKPAVEGTTADRILDAYRSRYAGEPFVRLYKHGQIPDLKPVQRTNFCDIGFRFDPATGRAVVVAVIDNLVKGAAGQAVQNMNLALGYEETAGLS